MLFSSRICQRRRSNQNGGVLVELTLVVPVIILLISAVFATGRLISQLAWLSQTSYQTYLIGTEYLTNGERELPMEGRSYILNQVNASLNRNAYLLDTSSGFFSYNYDANNDALTATVNGNLETLLGPRVSFGISMSVTGALLAIDAAQSGNLNEFENGQSLFNCQGEPCSAGTCPTEPCVSCPGEGLPGGCNCSANSPWCRT